MLSALFYSSQDEGSIFTSFCTIGLLIIWDAYSHLPIKTGRMKNTSVTQSTGNIWKFSTIDLRTRNDTQLKLSYLTRDTERWLRIWFWIQNWNGQWTKSKASQMMDSFSFRNKMIFPIVWSDHLLMAAFIHESLKGRVLLVPKVGPAWNRCIMVLICNPGSCSQALFGLWSYIFTPETNCYMLVCSVSCCFPACQRYVMLLKLFISEFV